MRGFLIIVTAYVVAITAVTAYAASMIHS